MPIKYLRALLAVSTLFGLSAFYVIIYFNAPSTAVSVGRGWDSVFPALLLSLLPNLIAVLVSFAAIYFLLELPGIIRPTGATGSMTLANLKSFYTAHRRVKWGDVYKHASTLDIGVFYYRSLPAENFEELKTFFRNGGHLRLIVADPEREDLLRIIGNHFFQGMPPAELSGKIRGSIELYRKAHADAGTLKGKIDVYAFQDLFHYTFTLADGHILYLSPYAQFEEVPQLLSPVTVIDTHSDRTLREYWDDQFEKFFQNSRLIA